MNTKNILFTAVLVAIGAFSTLSAQSDCKQDVKELMQEREPFRTDTTIIVDPESYEKTTKLTQVYLPGAPEEYDLVEEKGNMKIYYVMSDKCLMVRHIEIEGEKAKQ